MAYTKYLYRKADTEEEDVSYNTSTYSCSDGVQKYQEGSTYHSQDLVHVKGTPHEDTSYKVKGFFQGNAPAHFRIILYRLFFKLAKHLRCHVPIFLNHGWIFDQILHNIPVDNE